eukprot:3706619-Karenia_brevis.AAC.1
MLLDATGALAAHGFQWNESSLKYTHTSLSAGRHNFKINGAVQNQFMVKVVDELEVLGVLMSSSTQPTAAEHRLRKASSCFWACADYFTSKSIPLQKRFDEFQKRVITVA